MKYAPLHYRDKPKERLAAMKSRVGKDIYVYRYFDTLEEAKRNRINEPIGFLQSASRVEAPTEVYRGRLVKVEY